MGVAGDRGHFYSCWTRSHRGTHWQTHRRTHRWTHRQTDRRNTRRDIMASTSGAWLLRLLTISACLGHALCDKLCYSCSGIANPHNCQRTVACRSTQKCFSRAYISDGLTVLYDLGCQSEGFCNVLHTRRSADVTRGVWLPRRRRQYEVPLCTSCCDGEHCNVGLCASSQIAKPGGRKCYDCGERLLTDPAACDTVSVCGADQKCHVAETLTTTGRKFQVNCKSSLYCDAVGSHATFGKRSLFLCYTCCDYDNCNIDFCSKIRTTPFSLAGGATPATTTPSPRPTAPTTPGYVPLTIVQQPGNVSMEAAPTVRYSFQCQVDGEPKAKYSWTFVNASGVSVNVDSKVQTPGMASILTFDPVSVSDEGDYSCTADNGRETLVTSGHLSVFSEVRLLSPPLADVTVTEGQNVTLTCAYSSHPDPAVTWLFQNASGGGAYLHVTAGVSPGGESLDLASVGVGEEGRYRCVADNGHRSQQQEMSLTVQAPPVFIQPLQTSDVNLTLGQSWQYSCQATGRPAPRYNFVFRNQYGLPTLLEKIQLDQTTGLLRVDNVTSSVQGTFQCYASNSVATVSQTLHVNVT